MLLTILGVIVGLIVLMFLLAAMKPATFRVERSLSMNAPAERIFPLLNDFHNWGEWSPWEKLDPALKRTFTGSTSGKGAVYDWEGTPKVGQGRMEILESTPSSRLLIQLDFIKPFEAHNRTEFTFTPQGSGTLVNWRMDGKHVFMGKVMSVFINMDKLVGKDFETGLNNLKTVTER